MQRTNKQVMISFGQKEHDLLEYLDLLCEKQCMTRSGWIKQKIREELKLQVAHNIVFAEEA